MIESLQASPAALIGVCVVLGLCVGSFLNVVVYRLPKMMEAEWRADCAEVTGVEPPPREVFNLVTPRSRCPSCATPITFDQNIPVVSWLLLGGKCAACKARISARYPAVELAAGALAGFLAWRFGYSPALAGALIFAWSLLALALIDFDTQLLPDDITLPLLWTGLLFNMGSTFTSLPSAVLGAVAGYLSLWLVYWGFKLVVRKEGMGYGDFKLLAALGAWLGWAMLPFIVLVSAGLGAVIGLAGMALARTGRDTRIPFGPYLALGGLVGLLWGRQATVAWLGYFPS
ncbi:prepilin peptidase [Betaproteobacteria bacterium GR16-43]|nr:prepilin peptidase [Betaproteobacteria bacterium GR16-43]